MCGRYALVLRAAQIRRMLEDNDMPVWDAPEDDGDDAPRQSYNFAPGYHGMVYRADVPDYGAGPRRSQGFNRNSQEGEDGPPEEALQQQEPADDGIDEQQLPAPSTSSQKEPPHYILQTMKWGLIPFWTKRNPDYATVLRTINCRDDSLATPGGMWNTMKARKRCVVVAQGFYEWLKAPSNPKERIPHYIRRKDGQLLLLAGLWDCVRYEEDSYAASKGDDGSGIGGGEGRKIYTYTIITTDSNAQLKFLHDRMPVILEPGSDALRTWLDPGRYEWTRELQSLLKPWDGELEIYAVSKDVNKVGNSSPNFIIPVASRENKSNIANFFANAKPKGSLPKAEKLKPEVEIKSEGKDGTKTEQKALEEVVEGNGLGDLSQKSTASSTSGIKREASASQGSPPPKKMVKMTASPFKPASPMKSAAAATGRSKISATSNGTKSPSKGKSDGSQKITKFFANSS